jgi:SAM-dependent methyltransferase
MNLNEIRKEWVAQNTNSQSEVELWDSQAEDPTYHQMPTFQDNKFLQLLEQERMIDSTSDVLDIGCGAGVYSLALAQRVQSVTGVDFSPKMIQKAQEKLTDHQKTNVVFTCKDWNAVDLAQEGFKERFDLVFAHTSPAISDASTFEKMNAASKRFCVISNPTKMIEPVMSEVHKIAGVKEDEGRCGNTLIYQLDMLFQMGYLPKLAYENQIWKMDQSYEDACSYYLGRTTYAKPLTEDENNAVKEYLSSIAKDGRITDQIDATVTTIYWEK